MPTASPRGRPPPADPAPPGPDELFDAVIWQSGAPPEVAGAPGAAGLTTPMTSGAYRDEVAEAVTELRRPGAALRKVVLSRPISVRLDGPLPLSAVLRRLRHREPNLPIFSRPVPYRP